MRNPIKEWREQNRLSQVEAARKLGLNQQRVSLYERTRCIPSPGTVRRLPQFRPNVARGPASTGSASGSGRVWDARYARAHVTTARSRNQTIADPHGVVR